MRDIRPQPHKPHSSSLPGGDEEPMRQHIPKVAKPKVARRFIGSAVPVTKVHIPKQTLSSKTKAVEVAPEATLVDPETAPRPLFAKVKKAPYKKRRMRVGQRERLVLAALFVLILLAVGIAAAIFLPQATISVTLQAAPLLVDQTLTIQPDPSGPAGIAVEKSSDPTIVSGTAFTREVNVDGTFATVSRQVIGTKATGVVNIINRTTEEQKIKDKSRLVTKDGQLFYMQSNAILPAASGGVPTKVSVNVEADKAGPTGNIAPQRLTFAALDASASSLVYAENPQAFTTGTGEEVPVIQQADLDQAKKAAEDNARSQVEQGIRSALPNGWVILEESWTTDLTDFQAKGKINDQAASLPYSAKGVVRVMAYQDSQMQSSLEQALTAKLDPDFMLFPGPISFTKSVQNVDWSKPEAKVAVRITHTTIPNISLDTLRTKLAGREKTDALTYLEGLKGVRVASVDLWPFWVTSIPSIEKRVIINIEQDTNN